MFENYPDLLTIEQLQSALQLGRTKTFELVRSEKIKYLLIGKRIRVPKSFLIDFVKSSCDNDGEENHRQQVEKLPVEGRSLMRYNIYSLKFPPNLQ